MLALSRRRDEEILIKFQGQEIVLKVIGISGDKVRLGFDAPRDVIIDRKELHDQKIRDNNGSGSVK